MLLQELWKRNIFWDQFIEDRELLDEEKVLRSYFLRLHEVKIPRWIRMNSNDQMTLHVLCDASPAAYAAAVCAVMPRHSTLLIGTPRVAPNEHQARYQNSN